MRYILFFLCFSQICFAQKKPLQYVNPFIGSAPSSTESAQKHSEAGSELKGQIVPAIGVPQGMTTWTPQTRATELKCIPPFYYNDTKIQGFRGTHWMNGSCVQDYGSLTIMPLSGKLKVNPTERASSFNRKQEIAGPSYYSVTLTEAKVKAEMTATCRASILKFGFQTNKDNFILIEPNSDEGEGFVEIHPEKKEIVGYNPVHRIYQGSGKPAGFSGYFVIQFDKAFEASGTWQNNDIKWNSLTSKGDGKKQSLGAFVKFAGNMVKVRVGTSFSSLEGARKNLETEIPDWNFDKVKAQSEMAWKKALGKIKVQGSEDDKVLFYSALYHSKLTPRVFSDADGTYPGFADDENFYKAKGFSYYEDYNLWDTYRAVHPLHNLLEPKISSDMMESLVKKAEQGGWMPIFPCWNQYTAAMIGDHAIAAIGDAYIKGIKGIDIHKAYQYMQKNAFEVNSDPKSYEEGKGRRALATYLKYNYIPLEDSVWQAFHKREQVSRTLEYAYDDFVLAQVAKKLGKTEDSEVLMKRSQNFRNVIDPKTGYARGRYADGRWIEPFNPFAMRSSFITEGSPAQYTFYVPQDVQGLIEVVGGKKNFVSKLDTLFDKGYYWHGNEPNNQIVYLYPFAHSAWKTQERVRKIIREEYNSGPGGLSGNEDGGQMSAWLVFSMAGFYPVCPGTPYYIIGSPVFEETVISVSGGKQFIIKAKGNSDKKPYIFSARFNGKPYPKAYLTHEQIMKGGILELEMNSKPNPEWGNPPPAGSEK
ncbi:alpha-1,2-mannosidase, putative [Pseudarcicella hirudinis]|uniref:Alpha-1,2-mannosidase, putative n=1 Tax=Pseudarcicella hirudinis TaxID=1079859 RepID=A0A1I5TRL7_9BACT|nr:GH92 family glycosyl hydrolase [Pseudarcicella hirudinis]SFP85628.1 alpha-1,2-mannosidase, putative [Pseudarcicella hirudinis]